MAEADEAAYRELADYGLAFFVASSHGPIYAVTQGGKLADPSGQFSSMACARTMGDWGGAGPDPHPGDYVKAGGRWLLVTGTGGLGWDLYGTDASGNEVSPSTCARSSRCRDPTAGFSLTMARRARAALLGCGSFDIRKTQRGWVATPAATR